MGVAEPWWPCGGTIMRIAVLPIIGFRNVLGESDYLMYDALIRYVVSQGHFVYFCLPEEAIGKVPPIAGVKYIFDEKVGLWYDREADVSTTFLKLFSPRTAKYPVDVVLTSRATAVPVISRQLWDYRCEEPQVPVVIYEPKVASFTGTHQVVRDIELVGRTLGYALGHPVFSTQEELDLALEAARRFLSGLMVRQIQERAKIIPFGVDCDSLDAVIGEPFERFTVFFGGRLNRGSKRAERVVQTYDQFFRFGREIDVLLCTPKEDPYIHKVIGKRGAAEVRIMPNCSRDEFLAQAGRAHVYLNTSKYEGFSVGFMEQMYLMVGIIPDEPWCRAMLKDAFKRYPFVYRNMDEAAAMLRYVYENYDKAREQVAWLRDWIREEFGLESMSRRLLEVIEDAVERSKTDVLLSKGNVELLEQTLADCHGRFSFESFWDRLKKNSLMVTDDPKRGQVSRFVAYRWLCGRFRDDGKTEVAVFGEG